MTIDLDKILDAFDRTLPHFADGRIDYTTSPSAPVVTCFVQRAGKLLLLKRSDRVGSYRGKWDVVCGYVDQMVPIEQKIREELREELGLDEGMISSLRLGQPYVLTDREIGRTWITFPALAELQPDADIVLDWEHTEYRWIMPQELSAFDLTPELGQSYARIMSLN